MSEMKALNATGVFRVPTEIIEKEYMGAGFQEGCYIGYDIKIGENKPEYHHDRLLLAYYEFLCSADGVYVYRLTGVQRCDDGTFLWERKDEK